MHAIRMLLAGTSLLKGKVIAVDACQTMSSHPVINYHVGQKSITMSSLSSKLW